MAALTGNKIKDTYQWLLQVGASTITTLKKISLGNGTDSALSISETAAKVDGDFEVTGDIVNSGMASISQIDADYIKLGAAALTSTANVTAIDLDAERANIITLSENTVLTPSNGALGVSAIFYINANASSYTCGVSEGKLVGGADFSQIATLGASEIVEIVLSHNGTHYLWRLNIIDAS